MPGMFRARKILIHEKTFALLKLWEKILLSKGISDKENKHLFPDQKQLREMSIIETGARKSIEFISNKPHKVYQRDLPAHSFTFELNCEKVFELYCMALDEIYENANIKLLKTDNEVIDSHYILLGELLKRIVAQILDNRNLPNPHSDNENIYIIAFYEFCSELGKTEALIYREGIFTREPLFGKVMTPFAEHIGKMYEWEKYLKAAVNYNNIILKARNTARSCNKYFFTLINQIKQYLCIELIEELDHGDLNPDHIKHRYNNTVSNILKKSDNPKIKKKAKEILQYSITPTFTETQTFILASISDPAHSKLEPKKSKLEKLKQLYQFMNESQLIFRAFAAFDRIIAATGWTTIVLGVLNLDCFKSLIKSLTNKYQSILFIDQSLLSGSLGKEIIQSGTLDLKPLDLFSDTACGYLTSLASPRVQMQLLEWLKEDIEFLKLMENAIGLKLINTNNLPEGFQQLLNFNCEQQEMHFQSQHRTNVIGDQNNVDNISLDYLGNYAIQQAILYINHRKGDTKMSKSFFEIMAEKLNASLNTDFKAKSLREMCKQYYLAEGYNGKEKDKKHKHRKNKLKDWYVELATEYPSFVLSKKLDEINKYQIIEREPEKITAKNSNIQEPESILGHALIEGRILCQLHKHSQYERLKEFKDFYVTFIMPHETRTGESNTFTYESYHVDEGLITHFSKNLIDAPLNHNKIHIICKNGIYATKLDELPLENITPIQNSPTNTTDITESQTDKTEPVEVMPRRPSREMERWNNHSLFPNLSSKKIKFILDLKDSVDRYRSEGPCKSSIIPNGIIYFRQALRFNTSNISEAELITIINMLSKNKDNNEEGNAMHLYKKFYDRAQRQFPDLIQMAKVETHNQVVSARKQRK